MNSHTQQQNIQIFIKTKQKKTKKNFTLTSDFSLFKILFLIHNTHITHTHIGNCTRIFFSSLSLFGLYLAQTCNDRPFSFLSTLLPGLWILKNKILRFSQSLSIWNWFKKKILIARETENEMIQFSNKQKYEILNK